MRQLKTYIFLITGLIVLVNSSCTKEINFKTESFESALVVEATITNELKTHEILLSRTYMFEEEGPSPETQAEVKIKTTNEEFIFNEKEDGKYVSINEFKAIPNQSYTLEIITSSGRKYTSTPTNLTQESQIDQLYALRENNEAGNGMSIYIDTYDASGNSKYYRFTYEETYKIIAPMWVPEDVIVIDPTWPACSIKLIPKKEEKHICYTFQKSKNIIQTTTTFLNEDRVQKFLVRFISSDNYIISWRYSILVNQYIQSQESFNYYKTLNEFNEEGSIFSQTQPGFFNGNLMSVNNPTEKVVGYFDVSSVSSKRIFFNYEDFYPEEGRPNFINPCFEFAPVQNQGHPTDRCGSLIDGILANEIVYFKTNPNPIPTIEGPLIMVPRACGDCTALGSNVVPGFWEE